MIKSRSVRWTGHKAGVREVKIAYSILVENPERTRSFRKLLLGGRIILKWILENGINGVDWIHLVQNRGEHGIGPSSLIKCWKLMTSSASISLPSRTLLHGIVTACGTYSKHYALNS
jgi:hypothetical protein